MEDYIKERALLYGFLARGFLKEVDQEFLDTVKNLNYSDFDEDTAMDEGFRLLGGYVRKADSQTLLNLARDYARIFLGAGLAKNEGAYPYESVYTSGSHLLMQEARDEAVKLYASEELGRSDGYAEPEDHIAFELEFMARMCERAAEAAAGGDTKTFRTNMAKQHIFLTDHLCKWVPAFCDDVIKLAREDFYKAFAMITKGFLEDETGLIEDLINSY